MSFETTKQSPSSVRPTSKTGTMFGMVQLGKDAGFDKKRLDILGASDSFGVRHLDGDRSVEIVIVSQIDPSEPALTQASEDRVTPDLRGIAVEEPLEPQSGGCEPSVSDRSFVSSEEPLEPSAGGWSSSVSDRLFVSSIARSLTSIDLFHDCQAESIVSS